MSGCRWEATAKRSIAVLAMLVLSLGPAALAAEGSSDKPKEDKPPMDCEMTYSLKGWSAFYKTAKGEGTITCTNGQKANVTISVHGGGLTFGKTEIYNGKAKISGGRTIDDIYGSYASAAAHAGAGKAAEAEVLTKGEVSIALSGTGTGVDVGVDFSGFTISKAEAKAPPAPKDKK